LSHNCLIIDRGFVNSGKTVLGFDL
jgi:hypothetical protein